MTFLSYPKPLSAYRRTKPDWQPNHYSITWISLTTPWPFVSHVLLSSWREKCPYPLTPSQCVYCALQMYGNVIPVVVASTPCFRITVNTPLRYNTLLNWEHLCWHCITTFFRASSCRLYSLWLNESLEQYFAVCTCLRKTCSRISGGHEYITK